MLDTEKQKGRNILPAFDLTMNGNLGLTDYETFSRYSFHSFKLF